MVYPTYNSFLAIESPNDADDKQWLTYWVVVCTLQLIERPLYVVLYWVPLYSIFRLVLVAWLSHPQFKVSTEERPAGQVHHHCCSLQGSASPAGTLSLMWSGC